MKRAGLALGMFVCAACADERLVYAGLDLDVQSSPPSPVSVEPDRIELVAGEAVMVMATPRSSGELDYNDRDLLALRAQNPGFLDVYSTEDDREFVLVGVDVGETCLEVHINRHREECIPVYVREPATE